MVVIGGLGSLPGALLGAVYVRSADFFLPLDWQFLATGVGLLAVLLLLPSGLGGLMADLRDGALRRVARRRGLVVPSLLADVRVADADEDRSLEHAVAAAKAEEDALVKVGSSAGSFASVGGNGAPPPEPDAGSGPDTGTSGDQVAEAKR
jgi:hypothetical protein